MKLFGKIKAFFRYRNQDAELDVTAAEIKIGRIFLHPKDEPNRTYRIRTRSIEIHINPGANVREEDVTIIEDKANAKNAPLNTPPLLPPETTSTTPNSPTGEPTKSSGQKNSSSHQTPNAKENGRSDIAPYPQTSFERRALSDYMTKKKTLTFSLYPEEYDMFMSTITENGYKKTEFLLACVSSAKKKSMEVNYQKYAAAHKERRIAERQAAREAQEKDYQEYQKNIV